MVAKAIRPAKELKYPTVLYAAGWVGGTKLYLVDICAPGDKTAKAKMDKKIMSLHAAGVLYKTVEHRGSGEPPRTIEG